MSYHVPEQHRIKTGGFASRAEDGNNGAFFVKGPDRKESAPLRIIASDGLSWEHVSVSLPHRCPTWAEMCFVKSLFWDDEDCVMQLHPPKSDWVNNHNYCLHLWRPSTDVKQIPLPPAYLVGIKDMGVLA